MERDQIKKAVTEQICRLSDVTVSVATEIDEDYNLANDLGLDSLDAVETVMGLEKKLDLRIPDDPETEEMVHWTVRELIEFVHKLYEEQHAPERRSR